MFFQPLFIGWLLLFKITHAQDSILPIQKPDLSNPLPTSDPSINVHLPISKLEFQLSVLVLIFGFLTLLIELFLIQKRKLTAEESIKFIIITLIITATLFLITAGYSNDQIAPAIGLLGTIAGYLLGRMQKNPNPIQ